MGDLDTFRGEVRDWLIQHVPPDWRVQQTGVSKQAYLDFQRWWIEELREVGYAVAHWPKQWGGAEFSLAQQVVLYEELAKADAPRLALYFVSLNHAAATLLHAGDEVQKKRHLPGILNGEIWCQGFSEPNSGSDLASLQTRAVRDGDVYVLNGQKIWSSYAEFADWCILLARTDPTAPKRKGITFFLLDMRSAGVEVRPIRQATGDDEFCEIFLTDVRIPITDRIGDENDGWRIAQSTLVAERGLSMVELSERLRGIVPRLVEMARRAGAETRDSVAQELGQLHADVEVLRLIRGRMVENLMRHGDVGPEASIIKLYYSELLQRLMEFAVRCGGLEAQLLRDLPQSVGWESGYWMRDYLMSWQWTIAAGTNEIQRSLIAEKVLGLPRDPLMD
ncbi:acyl-CoA dehydrogenase family protein [Mycolicibacterium sp. P9-22]|uniref:acyl-CoA dehydrogenase family protein n=1 Tax=Mycolicibacterium sp. P9-22 TaxID=2024613 RepID=UPI001D14DDD8|nr:acyl-CoA dehydrogenase family protein [Mycolicibacterium sp. P9-22]